MFGLVDREWRCWRATTIYVSEFGDVGNLEYKRKKNNPKLLQAFLNEDGYLTLWILDKSRQVHYLVAECYLGPRPVGLLICHKELPSTNNHYTNLYYGTQAQNMQDCIRHGNRKNGDKRGSKNPKSIIDENIARNVKRCLAAGERSIDISNEYYVPLDIIGRIRRNEHWKHVSIQKDSNDSRSSS